MRLPEIDLCITTEATFIESPNIEKNKKNPAFWEKLHF